MKKIRLDQLLLNNKLAESREKAQRLIRAGYVKVNDHIITKPGSTCPHDVSIELKKKEQYVSRGGYKLEKALKTFDINLNNLIALDIGSSTGGFTDCILQNGAKSVFAVDCGSNQLHYNLRQDPRVVVMEQTNARYLNSNLIPVAVDFCSIDTSFISLTKILPPLKNIIKPGGIIVSLIKPQFEAGKEHVEKGGVVRDKNVHHAVIEKIKNFGVGTLGLRWMDYCNSPLKGPAGNIEFLAYWKI